MKSLLIFFVVFFGCAQAQSRNQDSTRVMEQLKQLQKSNDENLKLINQNIQYQKDIFRLLDIIKMHKKQRENMIHFLSENSQYSKYYNGEAVKTENRTNPVFEKELQVPIYYDSVRGGWMYRLLHKDDYVIKRYKIINNEKIYLD